MRIYAVGKVMHCFFEHLRGSCDESANLKFYFWHIESMITSKNIADLPTRTCFRTRALDADIAAARPFQFLITDVHDRDALNYGRFSYDLRLYGTAINGDKVCICIENNDIVYFDYDVSEVIDFCKTGREMQWRCAEEEIAAGGAKIDKIEQEGIEKMRAILQQVGSAAQTLRPVWLYPMHGFTLRKHLYIRVFFSNLKSRKDCINKILDFCMDSLHEAPNLLAHDDRGNSTPYYFDTITREYCWNAAGWNQVLKWSAYRCVEIPAARCGPLGNQRPPIIHEFRARACDIKPIIAQQQSGSDPDARERMNDRAIVECWDIETEQHKEASDIPHPGDGNYTITTISLVYSYAWTATPLACYVLTIYPSRAPNLTEFDKSTDTKFILCANESDLIATRVKIAARMLPDIRIAFNGANFDWPLLRDRAECLGLAREVYDALSLVETKNERRFEFSFAQFNVKIGADTSHSCACVAQFAGTLDVDLMPVMRRIYRNEEVRFAQSLNKYLANAKLPLKDDIHYKVMFHIFARARALKSAQPACHCDKMDACALCTSKKVREIDCEPVDRAKPMGEWSYHDGLDGRKFALRDPRLAKCCACGMRPLNEEDITLVNSYCARDSVRPLQLVRKLGIVIEMRELSNTTYTSLVDSFYRADGIRVVNFVAHFAQKYGLAASSSVPKRPRTHFKGAHVFPPVLGIHTRPVTALDFSSLYPSLILAYNISPDMIVTSKATADSLAAEGYELHHIKRFEYEELPADDEEKSTADPPRTFKTEGWTIRHSGILEPHKYGDVAPETVRILEDGSEKKGRRALLREHLGLFGCALRYLLNSRRVVRGANGMARIEGQIAEIYKKIAGRDVVIEARDGLAIENQAENMLRTYAGAAGAAGAVGPDVAGDISNLIVTWKCLNSKQLALKILSNTFYGQMSSAISSCFTLIGGAGVTAAGRYNIKLVARYLTELGYTIAYGDTDSVYTRAPEAIYSNIDAAWKAGEIKTLEEYWGQQIIAARADMEILREKVSRKLRADNGTQFLSMAYEEVGMPTVFLGKKKYILRPHVKGVTFTARPMVRGLETVKRGHAAIVKDYGDQIINDLLQVREDSNVIDIIRAAVDRFYTACPDIAQFIQYKTYKSHKNNTTVICFVQRMRERHDALVRDGKAAEAALFAPPEDGDKFPFLIVQRGSSVSCEGHVRNYKVGERMEYPDVVRNGSATLDRDYYLAGALSSLFARFVACDKLCEPSREELEGVDVRKNYTAYDEIRLAKATTIVANMRAKYAATNTSQLRTLASTQRSVAGAFRSVISARKSGDSLSALGRNISELLVSERTRELCGGDSGALISDECIGKLIAHISEISRARTTAERAEEDEQTEKYAQRLMRVNGPRELAQRYSRDVYMQAVIGPLEKKKRDAEARIASGMATRFVTLYRRCNIGKQVQSIAEEMLSAGVKGKKNAVRAIEDKIKFDQATMSFLGEMGRAIDEYAECERALMREGFMRERFAADFASAQK